MKSLIITIVVVLLVGIGAYFLIPSLLNKEGSTIKEPNEELSQSGNEEQVGEVDDSKTVLGKSVEGRDITAYHYGVGDTELLFVGGIHGGYSWNTSLVAFEMMDYLEESPESIPQNIKVTVIPVLNPDGLDKVVGTDGRFTKADVPTSRNDVVPGRFNANNVDLNRNFDCDWQTDAMWQSRSVSGGSAAFSEPESEAIKNYVEVKKPSAVVVWYSSAGGVFASSCHNGVLPETLEITNTYSKASGYPAFRDFNFYEITGDMVNWLAKKNIPAISILLTTHEATEWSKNKLGIEALFEYYSE